MEQYSNGANPNLEDKTGMKALQIARFKGYQDIVDIIERWAINRIKRVRADLRMRTVSATIHRLQMKTRKRRRIFE